MRARRSPPRGSTRTRAAAPPRDARSTRPRRDSPWLVGDETLGRLLAPYVAGRLARVCVDDQAVDLGLAIVGEEALDCLAHDVRARPPRAGPVRVEAPEELVGELHEGLRAGHCHMVAIWSFETDVCDNVRGDGARRRDADPYRPAR